jgi:hypothetical protein
MPTLPRASEPSTPIPAKAHRTACLVLAFLSLPCAPPPSAAELVWAPLLDQFSQRELEGMHRNPFEHPDFPVGQDRKTTREKIARALIVAHGKGIRIIDVEFFMGRDQVEPAYGRPYSPADPARPPIADSTLDGLANCGEDWVRAVAVFNAAHPKAPLKLRLRIAAHAYHLHWVLRTLKPHAAGLPTEDWRAGRIRSRFKDMPFDQCFEIPDPGDPCYSVSQVPGDYYRARDATGRFNRTVANLANPAVRSAIARWTSMNVQTVKAMTGPGTVIEEVSLALDAGWETGLFLDDGGGVAGFGSKVYAADSSLAWKAGFYRDREAALKESIKAFATAAHAERNHDGSRIRAGVFQQTHHLDGRSRGTFDLYDLLKGSGADVLHHTHPPVGDARWNLAWAAYSATVAGKLGIDFDTEFSWAHFGGPALLVWKQEFVTEDNANRFLMQAKAGLRYGASAVVFANWTMHDIMKPPRNAAWQSLIGSPEGAPGMEYLRGKGGLLDAAPFKGPARRALYVSTMGRLECEEAKAKNPAAPEGCDARTYQAWFGLLGLRGLLPGLGPLETGRIDILTDGMIRDGKADWNGYDWVYLPYHTSRSIDRDILTRLQALPAALKERFRHQRHPGGAAESGFLDWSRDVRMMASVAAGKP